MKNSTIVIFCIKQPRVPGLEIVYIIFWHLKKKWLFCHMFMNKEYIKYFSLFWTRSFGVVTAWRKASPSYPGFQKQRQLLNAQRCCVSERSKPLKSSRCRRKPAGVVRCRSTHEGVCVPASALATKSLLQTVKNKSSANHKGQQLFWPPN